MKKFLLINCLAVFTLFLTVGKAAAQTSLVLDTLQADGYLRIVAHTLKNLLVLVKLNQSEFEEALKVYGYKPDPKAAKGTYKIESLKATYNIYKDKYEVEYYFPTMAGSLISLKTEVKKRFPKTKITGEGTETQIYEFEEKNTEGMHTYMLNMYAKNGKSVFISLTMF